MNFRVNLKVPLEQRIVRANIRNRAMLDEIREDTTISNDAIVLLSAVGILAYYSSHTKLDTEDQTAEKRIKEFIERLKQKIYLKYSQGAINYSTRRVKEILLALSKQYQVNLYMVSAFMLNSINKDEYPLIAFEREFFRTSIDKYKKWGDTSKANYKKVRSTILASNNIIGALYSRREITTEQYEKGKAFIEKMRERR